MQYIFYINRPHQNFNFHLVFEFDQLATYRNVTHGEWKEDGMIEMYRDPVVKEWPDTPHIFRVYKGETELTIQVDKIFVSNLQSTIDHFLKFELA